MEVDADELRFSLYDWQHRLNLIASEMEALADQGFQPLYDVMGLVTDACSRIDEVRP